MEGDSGVPERLPSHSYRTLAEPGGVERTLPKKETPLGAGCGCLMGSVALGVLLAPWLGVVTLVLGVAIIVMIEARKKREEDE